VTWPPPPPKVQAIAAAKPKEKPKELTPAERRAQEVAAFQAQTKTQVSLLVGGGALVLLLGLVTPATSWRTSSSSCWRSSWASR
jgi:H+-translocating NAD(P) transhydrogenase subunit alpha